MPEKSTDTNSVPPEATTSNQQNLTDMPKTTLRAEQIIHNSRLGILKITDPNLDLDQVFGLIAISKFMY